MANGQQPGFRALKPWEKDGKWGVAVSEHLVPAYDMTREEALKAIDDYYKLGGQTEQEHTDAFHKFYDERRDLARQHLEDARKADEARGPHSRINRGENPNADTFEQEKAAGLVTA